MQTACCEMDRKEKQGWWFLIVSASYTIDQPETNALSFQTGVCLECGYEDLPVGIPILISSSFSQMCKQGTKYNISDITL